MNIQIDADVLRSLIQEITQEVFQQIDQDRVKLNGQLALKEPQAAAKLGVKRHQLRDWRLLGKVRAHKPGREILYLIDELLEDIARL